MMADQVVTVEFKIKDNLSSKMGKINNNINNLGKHSTNAKKNVNNLGLRMGHHFGNTSIYHNVKNLGVAIGVNLVKSLARATVQMGKMVAMKIGRWAKESFNSFMELSEGIAEVSTLLTEADLSKIGGLPALQKQAQDLSKTFGEDVTKTTKAMYSAISSGADSSRLNELMEIAGKLKVGGVTDLETSVNGLTNLANAYGIAYDNVDRLNNISDDLFIGMKKGKTTVGELAGSLGKVAPLASSMNVSVEELVASVSGITTSGVKTTEAITQMKGVLTKILKPTESAKKLMNELGIEYGQTALENQTLSEWLSTTKTKLDASGKGFQDLFGNVRGLQGALSLTGEAGKVTAEAMAMMAEASQNAGQVTEGAFKKIDDTSSQKLKKLNERWNVFSQNMGASLADGLTKGMEAIYSLVDLLEKNIDFDKIAEAFTNVIQTIISGFNALRPLLTKIFSSIDFDFLKDMLSWISDIFMNKILPFFVEIGPKIKKLTQSFGEFLNSLKPIAEVLIDIILQLIDKLVPTLTFIFEAVSKILEPAGKLIKMVWDFLEPQLMPALEQIGALISWLGELVTNSINMWQNLFGGFFALITGDTEKATKFFTEAWNNFSAYWKTLWEGISTFFTDMWNRLSEWWSSVIDNFVGIFTQSGDNMKSTLSGVGDFFKSVWQSIADFFKSIVDAIVRFFENNFGHIVSIIDNVVGQVKGAIDWVKNLLGITKDTNKEVDALQRKNEEMRGKLVETQQELAGEKIKRLGYEGAAKDIYGEKVGKAINDLANSVEGATKKIDNNTKKLGGGAAMSEGGIVGGGIPNKDSVPTLLMPGEFVLKKSVVDELGTDYLNTLNNQEKFTNNISVNKKDEKIKQNTTTNTQRKEIVIKVDINGQTRNFSNSDKGRLKAEIYKEISEAIEYA